VGNIHGHSQCVHSLHHGGSAGLRASTIWLHAARL
jgi:hypothetical protein